MTAPQTPRDHALKVAVLDAILEEVKKEYAKAREEAEQAFAAMHKDGNDRQHVLLPDGEKIGQVSVKDPPPVISFLNGDLKDWAEKHIGDEAFEEYLPDSVKDSKEVLGIVKASGRPGLVGRRLRSRTALKLTADLLKSGGVLEDETTHKKERVADVKPGAVTGDFAFTDRQSKQRRERIMAELIGGNPVLRELVGFGPLALPAGEPQ